MIKKHLSALCYTGLCWVALASAHITDAPAFAQEDAQESIQETTPSDDREKRAAQSLQYILERAELIRMLAAEHLNYLDSQNATAEARLIEDGSEVMAYSLVCDEASFQPAILNRIAAEATLKIALMVETSPVKSRITDVMGTLEPKDRLTLVADISSTVLMFRIGRKRGLFDALLTDFGTRRFCVGMKSGVSKRYNDLAAILDDTRR